MYRFGLFLLLTTILSQITIAQKPSLNTGPIIKDHGAVYKVNTVSYKVTPNQVLAAVFDVDRTFNAIDKKNPLLETAARYLNLHGSNGFKSDQLKAALVIHGSAAQDLLNDNAYKNKHGVKNPNTELIKSLHKSGVKIILCGQTAAHRDIKPDDLLPEIQIALSAMTALVDLQNKGYRLIKF